MNDFEPSAAWESLSEDSQSTFLSLVRGAPRVGTARDRLLAFQRDHEWGEDQYNALVRWLRTQGLL